MLDGNDIRHLAAGAAEEALDKAAKRVLNRAERNIPRGDPSLDPNPNVTLKESGHIERHGPRVREVVFDTPYAAWIHENQHAKHPRGGGAKYLENALKAELPHIEGIVAGEVRSAVTRRR